MMEDFIDWLYHYAPDYIYLPALLLSVIAACFVIMSWLVAVILLGWFGIVIFVLPFVVIGYTAHRAYKKDTQP
jgi:prepilin signal peptidase PulO-like enzyme (type II secretory pathway)